jgi:SAM-dependent methyltransferase
MSTEYLMKTEVERPQAYHEHERGDRTRPRKSDRNYRALVMLLDKLRRVVDSDLLEGGDKILDYGCGNKPYRELFGDKFRTYVGADIVGNREAELVLDREGKVPAEDASFDCVLSSQVLEHVTYPRLYLAEAHRLLKPGGSLVLSTHGIWPYHPDPTDYWRWTIEGLQFEVRQAGFEIVMMQSVFGVESSALQLWQDATYERLPNPLRRIYTWVIQSMIGVIERRRQYKVLNDASTYVVLARKPSARVAGQEAEH